MGKWIFYNLRKEMGKHKPFPGNVLLIKILNSNAQTWGKWIPFYRKSMGKYKHSYRLQGYRLHSYRL